MNDFNGLAEILVPLAAIVCLFGLPVLAFVFFRLMAHRERMEMIRNGLMPPGPAAKNWRSSAPSAVTSAAPLAEDKLAVDNAQVTLRKGITLTFIGFAITLGLSFIGFHDYTWRPGPWLLGGLIPLFVGLAQVTIALISGATLGSPPPRSQQTYYAGAPPSPGPGPDFESSYTYRPGGTQELRPPITPPEKRS